MRRVFKWFAVTTEGDVIIAFGALLGAVSGVVIPYKSAVIAACALVAAGRFWAYVSGGTTDGA